MSADPISCAAGCKRNVADQSEAEAKAWTYLEITKRYRCPDCTRELNAVNQLYKEQDGKREE